jgi:light-regulated signal transduction histidine kinase (bacteriophytochrome)
MTEILDRLLSLSTVANTRFSREHVEMKALAEEIFEDLEVSDSGPAVDFFAEDVPDAMAEPVLVQILVMNLFSNALKYTRSKADRKIMFSSKEIDGETAYYVQDNGIGFDSEFAERVFSAFERLPGNGQTEGLGLGLDIASRVVRRHDGRIWAEGRPGAGATFYFKLGDNGAAG